MSLYDITCVAVVCYHTQHTRAPYCGSFNVLTVGCPSAGQLRNVLWSYWIYYNTARYIYTHNTIVLLYYIIFALYYIISIQYYYNIAILRLMPADAPIETEGTLVLTVSIQTLRLARRKLGSRCSPDSFPRDLWMFTASSFLQHVFFHSEDLPFHTVVAWLMGEYLCVLSILYPLCGVCVCACTSECVCVPCTVWREGSYLHGSRRKAPEDSQKKVCSTHPVLGGMLQFRSKVMYPIIACTRVYTSVHVREIGNYR